MNIGLLLNNDAMVAEYLFKYHVTPRMNYDAAIGILTDGILAGGVLLQSWNGFNVELSYYGRGTLTHGVIRCLARIVVSGLNPSRVTVTVNRKNRMLMRGVRKLGFVLEGTQRRFYGDQDINRNIGVRFVMFRERLEALAQLGQQKDGQCRSAQYQANTPRTHPISKTIN
jgi:hypothetical protein